MSSNNQWMRIIALQKSDARRQRIMLRQGTIQPSVATTTIRCSGKLHKISWINGGPIVTHHHTKQELAAMQVFRQLGDKQCNCLDFVEQLKKPYAEPPRREFKEMKQSASSRQSARASRQSWKQVWDTAQIKSEAHRIPAHVTKIARTEAATLIASSLERCEYPGTSPATRSRFGNYKTRVVVAFTKMYDTRHVFAESRLEFKKGDSGERVGALTIDVVTSLAWTRLFRLGVGVVDGMLALQGEQRGPRKWAMVLAKMTMDRDSGFKPAIRSQHAIVEIGDDGQPHVREWRGVNRVTDIGPRSSYAGIVDGKVDFDGQGEVVSQPTHSYPAGTFQ